MPVRGARVDLVGVVAAREERLPLVPPDPHLLGQVFDLAVVGVRGLGHGRQG